MTTPSRPIQFDTPPAAQEHLRDGMSGKDWQSGDQPSDVEPQPSTVETVTPGAMLEVRDSGPGNQPSEPEKLEPGEGLPPVPRSAPASLRQQLHTWMHHCRNLTLALVENLDYNTLCRQVHPDFSPIGWHVGHIAYTESLWLLEHLAGHPTQFPEYRRLFAADGLPKAERVRLPTLPDIHTYLSGVREQVFTYLETAPLEDQEQIWRFLLQHESQHCETIAIVLSLLEQQLAEGAGKPGIGSGRPEANQIGKAPLPSPQILIPAGTFQCGSHAIDALDNERPAHPVFVDTYWIDRDPVTCQQYRTFMAAGGYDHECWWSPEGWVWLQSANVNQPLYWQDDPAWDDHPVCGVSWYEADAYARFAGKRLPTEFEWEKAASWNAITQQAQPFPWGETDPTPEHCNHSHLIGHTTPVNQYPAGVSPYGCYDMLGNVWEWTASWFSGYEGFEPFPYRGYSQAYFDGQHRVLRGGSWATRPWSMRCAFRNWYHPHVREILAGFRCASDR